MPSTNIDYLVRQFFINFAFYRRVHKRQKMLNYLHFLLNLLWLLSKLVFLDFFLILDSFSIVEKLFGKSDYFCGIIKNHSNWAIKESISHSIFIRIIWPSLNSHILIINDNLVIHVDPIPPLFFIIFYIHC